MNGFLNQFEMINLPLENSAVFNLSWMQVRPVVTQIFGINKSIYSRFGMQGHNGIDFRAPVGTPVFAPASGMVKIKSHKGGYGLHVSIRLPWPTPYEIKLGHLSSVDEALDGKIINTGTFIGKTGNTGISTGPHLHIGLRFLIPTEEQVIEFIKEPNNIIFDWEIKDNNNGFLGYVDIENSMIANKGSINKTTLTPSK